MILVNHHREADQRQSGFSLKPGKTPEILRADPVIVHLRLESCQQAVQKADKSDRADLVRAEGRLEALTGLRDNSFTVEFRLLKSFFHAGISFLYRFRYRVAIRHGLVFSHSQGGIGFGNGSAPFLPVNGKVEADSGADEVSPLIWQVVIAKTPTAPEGDVRVIIEVRKLLLVTVALYQRLVGCVHGTVFQPGP